MAIPRTRQSPTDDVTWPMAVTRKTRGKTLKISGALRVLSTSRIASLAARKTEQSPLNLPVAIVKVQGANCLNPAVGWQRRQCQVRKPTDGPAKTCLPPRLRAS